MSHRCLEVVLLAVACCVGGGWGADGQGYEPLPLDPQAGYTLFCVPPAPQPPTIDGIVSPGEWDRAFLINAMADQSQRWAVLYPRWARWQLMWDQDHLYLCSESQRLPRENLTIAYRDETLGGNTVMDDSIEIHFTPVGRNALGKKLPWSAQAILNPLGVGYYSRFTWAVAARSTAWKPDWRIGSQIHPDRWVMEIAVPRESLDLLQPNQVGDPWSFLLARNWKSTGWNQSALPGRYSSFGVPREHVFGYLTDSAYARLNDVSGLFAGAIHTDLTVGNAGTTAEKVTVELVVQEAPPAAETAPLLQWEKRDELTVEPGQQLLWTVREENKLEMGKRYRYTLQVTGSDVGRPLLMVNFLVEPGSDAWLSEAAQKLQALPYSFSAQLAPMKSVLEAFADFLFAPDPEAVKSLSVKVMPAGEPVPIFSGASENIHYRSLRARFQLPELAPGRYECQMQLLDAEGRPVAEATEKVEKRQEAQAFPWFHFSGGRTDRVLWPYSPLTVHHGGAKIDYWGGSYYLNGLCLPRQVSVTANREWRPPLLEERPSILSREVHLTAVQNGRPAMVRMQGFPRTTDVQAHLVSLRGYGMIGDTVEVQADAQFHQDGLLWVTLTLRPGVDSSSGQDVRLPEATLDRLTVDLPFREAVARFIVAHGAPGYGSYTLGAVPPGEGVVWDCTQVGRSVLVYGDLLPVVWLGHDQRGLCFFAENNRGWQHRDLPDQQVVRADGEVILRLNILQEPVTLSGDRSFSFGLLATPLRPMVPGWRMLNCSFSQNFADGFQTGRTASREAPYNASYMPASYAKSRLQMFDHTQNMIYRAFEFAPHTEQGSYESRSTDEDARHYFGPEWAANTYTREFQNHLLWALQRWMDEGGLTGLYHDQFCPYPMTNSITGAAWILPDGRTNPGYNLRLDRELVQREYALFLENGIQPRIFCHTTNGGEVYAYPWVSAILDGEDNMVIANADYDFVDLYPPERMQAYGNPWPWGNTFYWMRLIQPGEEQWQRRQDRAYFGWTYLHDVFNNNGGEAALWPKLFEWGMNDREVKFWPYWRNEAVLYVSDRNVLVSMWTLPDRALLCLFNTSKQTVPGVTVRLPTVDLGLLPMVRTEFTRAYDLETGEAVGFDGWNGAVTTSLAGHDYRLVVVRKYRD